MIRGGFPKKVTLALKTKGSCGSIGHSSVEEPLPGMSEARGSNPSMKSQNKTALKADGSFKVEGTPGHRMTSAKIRRQELI
jgi:hypothetical protein